MATYQQLPINFTGLAQFLLNFELIQGELVELSIKLNNYEHRAIQTGRDSISYMHIFRAEFDTTIFPSYEKVLEEIKTKIQKNSLTSDGTYTIDHHYMGNGHISVCLINHKSL